MRFLLRSLVSVLLAGSAAVLQACLLDSSGRGPPGTSGESSGSGGAGGNEGGAGSGTTSSGGTAASTTTDDTTSTTASASTATAAECEVDPDCPDPEPANPCLDPACVNRRCYLDIARDGEPCGEPSGVCYTPPECLAGECVSDPRPFGDPLPDSDLKDCNAPACDGRGGETTVPDDTQAPDETECADRYCEDGAVKVQPKSGATTCTFGMFKCCDGHCCDALTCLGCID